MFQTKLTKKIKTQILRSVTFFFEQSTIHEIMWKNKVEMDLPHDNVIQCMRFV